MKIFLQKHRKKLVILPVILLIIGGISVLVIHQFPTTQQIAQSDSTRISKFNEDFPAPSIRDKEKNKFELYMQSQRDTALLNRNGQLDKRIFNPGPPDDAPQDNSQPSVSSPKSSYQSIEQQERQMNQQMERIMQEINKKPPEQSSLPMDSLNLHSMARQNEIKQLEDMIASLQQSGNSGESEIYRLNGMLEKLVALEEPAPVDTVIRSKDTVYYHQVTLKPASVRQQVGFYALPIEAVTPQKKKKAIKALALAGQVAVNGSTVKLRLMERIYLDQVEIPAFTQIDGVCRISDERLLISIDRIIHDGVMFPVQLAVYDMQGMPGLHAPGAITRDAAKEQLAQTMQSAGRFNVTTGVIADVTASAVQGVGNMLSRKARLVSVRINNDFQVYLQ